MKLIFTSVLLCALLVGCRTSKPAQTRAPKTTFSSFDRPEAGETRHAKDAINFQRVDFHQLLPVYQETANRTVIPAAGLPNVSVTLRNQAAVTRTEILQLFDTALALNGVAMVFDGDKTVKAVPIEAAAQEPGPVIDLPAEQLPDSGSYMVRIVRLKKSKPSELVPVVQPFAKVPNGIIPMDAERILVLRDFSSNIKQMLKVIDLAEGGAGR